MDNIQMVILHGYIICNVLSVLDKMSEIQQGSLHDLTNTNLEFSDMMLNNLRRLPLFQQFPHLLSIPL